MDILVTYRIRLSPERDLRLERLDCDLPEWWLHLPAISGYAAFHSRLCRYVRVYVVQLPRTPP